jgi:4-hydroxyproline epimerase
VSRVGQAGASFARPHDREASASARAASSSRTDDGAPLETPKRVRVVDSHTEGEPTRVVIEGWPQPSGDTMAARRDYMRAHQDHLRRAVVREPRGFDALVGALLTPPEHDGSVTGVVFFNNGTYLGMCGHGLIGVVRTLEHLRRIEPGSCKIDTPVGTVEALLSDDGTVTITNVPARCHALDVRVDVPGVGAVIGDIAYGGNWFFITHESSVPVRMETVVPLTRLTTAIQDALRAQGLADVPGGEVDHIEISAPPTRTDADARNFVLCSGGEYDRSPCGTGTSAKMAVLHARGELAIGQLWRQESVTGSLFTGWLTHNDTGDLVPHIRGSAYVTGESVLHFDARDPFRLGIG